MRYFLITLTLSFILLGLLYSNTLHVPEEYGTIQIALSSANENDTVLVEPGTYHENIFWPETNSIKLLSVTDSSDTIIDGGGNFSVLIFSTELVIDTNTVINGFTITNGYNINGGGIYINGSSPKLSNLRITENHAEDYGGGIYCFDNCNSILINSLVDNNGLNGYDSRGGGISIKSSKPTISDCIIKENTTYGGSNYGGGIYYEGCNQFPLVENSIIENNESQSFGGGISIGFSNTVVSNTIIRNNKAAQGAGLEIHQDNGVLLESLLITNNTADVGVGGGIASRESNFIMNNSVIKDNYSTSRGGALYIEDDGSPQILNTLIVNNNSESSSYSTIRVQFRATPIFENVVVSNNGNSGFSCNNEWNSTKVHLENVTIANNNGDGISCSGTLDNVSIYNNIGYGIYATNDLDVSNSNILRNSNYAADSNNLDYNLILANNYWNDQSGPYHPIHNSSGLGDTTTFYIDEITPWLTEPDINAPPIPPHNLSILQASNNSISVQWDESLLSDFNNYKVYYDTDESGYPYSNGIELENINNYTFDNLSFNTTYHIAVTAIDNDGNESWYSNEISVQTINVGCTDEQACNYDSDAIEDDGSCSYPEGETCDCYGPIDGYCDCDGNVEDCNGDCSGEAFLDACNVCSGGLSEHEADSDIDCNGNCFGGAFMDECGNCYPGGSEYQDWLDYDCNDISVLIDILDINPNLNINFYDFDDYASLNFNLDGRITRFMTPLPIYRLPDSFCTLEALAYIQLYDHQDFGYADLEAIPENIGNLTNLVNVQISGASFSYLPESFTDLINLTTLDIDAELTSLPENFGDLVNLEGISLGGNQLIELPESFGNLTNLLGVNIEYNQLIELPESFGNLDNLENLYVQGNNFIELPEVISDLESLERLTAGNEQLVSLPESFGDLNSLTDLTISGSQIQTLPESFGNLENLYWLVLSYNQLISLPQSIGNLYNLEYLYLNNNQLTSLPETIGDLNINTLQLNYNQLTFLPESIGNLNDLVILNLEHNQLSAIPDSLINLGSLITLQLRNNLLISLPEEWIMCGLPHSGGFIGNNLLCEEFHYNCISDMAWDDNGYYPQDQSNCCEGADGQENWHNIDGCGVCDGDNSTCLGCTNENAVNYNEDAIIDDESCIYSDELDPHYTPIWDGNPNNPMAIYINSVSIDNQHWISGDEIAVFDGNDCVGTIMFDSTLDQTPTIYASEFTEGNPITYKYWDYSQEIEVINIISSDEENIFIPLGGVTVDLTGTLIYGCMDDTACNYDENSTVQDECIYIHEDECDCDGNILDDCGVCGGLNGDMDDCGVCDGDNSTCSGCTDQYAINYDEDATIEDNTCEYPETGDLNNDTIFNIQDIIMMINYLLNAEYVFYADLNEDDFLNVLDILILVNWILE